MNIDGFAFRQLQSLLENMEMSHRINQNTSQSFINSSDAATKNIAWGMEHANSSYTEQIKQLRSLVEEMGKGSLYLVEDVVLDGGIESA